MKKTFIVGLLIGIIATTSLGVYGSASAECFDEADLTFLEFIDVDSDNISFKRIPLYNECLEQNGWQYDFELKNTYGFALITDIDYNCGNSYAVEEVYYEKKSPFKNCEGLPIYITFNQYFEYNNNCFIDLLTGNELNDDLLTKAVEKGFGYLGSGSTSEVSEKVYYANKTENSFSIKGDLPKYSGVEGGTNCANVAGSIIIGYYDRFCENLIPNFTTYYALGTAIIYKSMSAEVGAVVTSLYNLMGTDVAQVGTTFTGFQSGMTGYARDHGCTYSSESVLSGGLFDFNKYRSAVENNKPVALFLSVYALVNQIQENNGEDTIISNQSTYAHVAVACGYKQHIYYNSNGQKTAERTYLKISSGLSAGEICYLNINSVSNIDKAISVTIS